jgi:TatD DNase family protein
MYVDSHCHLTFEGLADRIDDVRAAMRAADVDRALVICTTLEEFDRVHALAVAYDNFWCSAGVHPDNEGVREPSLEDLLTLASKPRVVAIGETGLDYYRLNGRSIDGDMQWQRERFRTHIRAARACAKPLVIHTRSASDDTLAILREEGAQGPGAAATGVFHCFTESAAVARAALDLGYFISFSGIVTFRNAQELREVARFVPADRLLIETDSPYLAPVPHRGKTNQPAFVADVGKAVAQLRGMAPEDLAAATSANFERLFFAART